MNLEPVRFKNTKDLLSFIDRLYKSGHITLGTKDNQQKITSVSEQFNTLFLKSRDGSIYLLEDVQQFVQEASDEDIAATKASFVIAKKNKGFLPQIDALLQNLKEARGDDIASSKANSTIAEEDKTVTLAQIKADSGLYAQIERDTSLVSSITMINLTIYSYTEFPSLKTIKDIKAAKEVFDNTNVHRGVKSSISGLSIGQSIGSIFISLNKLIFTIAEEYPLPKKVSELFQRTNLDILRLALTQEAKLKAHILTQRALSSNQQEIEELNKWISELDKNNEKTKELLQNIKKFLNNQCDKIKTAQTKYKVLTQNPLSPEELLQQKNALLVQAAERKKQLERLEKKEKLYNVLKPIAVYGTLIGPLLLLAAGLLTVTLLFIPVLLPLTVLILTGLVGLTFWFSSDIQDRIEDKFSLYNERMAIESNDDEALIELNMKFVEYFSPIEKDLELCAMEYRAFVETVEADLQEIALLDASEPLNKKSEVPSTVSSHSLFKVTKMKESSDPEVVDLVEDKVKTDTSETSYSYQ